MVGDHCVIFVNVTPPFVLRQRSWPPESTTSSATFASASLGSTQSAL
jgi:hypothetical protein